MRGRNRESLDHSFLSSTKRSSMDFDDSRSSSVDRGEKIFVNLEEVALEEDKLAIMLEVNKIEELDRDFGKVGICKKWRRIGGK